MLEPQFWPRVITRALLLLALGMSLMAFSQAEPQTPAESHIDRVVRGLRPPVTIKNRPAPHWTLADRMAALRVPGVSIAIIDKGQIVWAGGFGVTERGAADRVTTSTLFQAQSISKPVTATAMLRLVEAGELSLDEDVNEYLTSWKIPATEFTSRERVTLRRIVSHNAGFTVGGFGGYRLGEAVPSLMQILNGNKPANNPGIRVDVVPGSLSRYSGGGLTVLQQLLIDVTGESFPALMKRLVLVPAAMTLSTFDQPLPEARRKQAASGHDGKRLMMAGRWPIHPEMAAAGLWTTPTDLAKWMIQLSNAWNGRPNKLLSKNLATQMLTMQHPPYGLGLVLEGADQSFRFRHTGANLGFRAEVEMYPGVGKGAVVMTNADLGGYLMNEIFLSIAAEFDWPARRQTEREAVTVSSKELDRLVGVYTVAGPFGPVEYKVSREGDRLFAELKGFGPKSELFANSSDSFFSADGPAIVFAADSLGRVVKATLGGQIEAVRKQ